MPSFAKQLFWYLRRPVMYPDLARRAIRHARRIFLGKDDKAEARRQSVTWCTPRAISTTEALIKITGSAPAQPLKTQFADIFKRSEEAAAACPVKMGGPGDLDLLHHLAEFLQARKVIETGVAYGWSSLALLLSIQKRDGVVVSTDLPYAGMDNDPYVGCVVPDDLRKHWKLLRGRDRKRVPEAIEIAQPLDLCHYDSDKSYSGRMWTYPRLWKALRAGGIFISDDICDDMGFADFAKSLAIEPIIVNFNGKFVGILIK